MDGLLPPALAFAPLPCAAKRPFTLALADGHGAAAPTAAAAAATSSDGAVHHYDMDELDVDQYLDALDDISRINDTCKALLTIENNGGGNSASDSGSSAAATPAPTPVTVRLHHQQQCDELPSISVPALPIAIARSVSPCGSLGSSCSSSPKQTEFATSAASFFAMSSYSRDTLRLAPLSESSYQLMEGTAVIAALDKLESARRELERELAAAQLWFQFLKKHKLDVHLAIQGFFGFLPDELTLHIFSFLPAKALQQCASVCKHWRVLATDNLLWKALSLQRWPRLEELYLFTAEPWKWIYRSQANQFLPNDVPHGCGYHIQPNGNIYHGDWYYGKRHGWGISVMSNGRVYEGGFQNDKRSGWGVFRWPGGQNAGDTYVGEWKDSKRHGHGVYTWADGRVYEGQWSNDKRAGGKSTYPDGHIYEGQYCRGKRHGKGKTIYPDGSIYEGGYRNNKRHGHGVFTWKDGDQFSGEWKSGGRFGFGVYIRHETKERINQYWEEQLFDMNEKGKFGVLNPAPHSAGRSHSNPATPTPTRAAQSPAPSHGIARSSSASPSSTSLSLSVSMPDEDESYTVASLHAPHSDD